MDRQPEPRAQGIGSGLFFCVACGWRLPVADFRATYTGKNLGSPRLMEAFGAYLTEFAKARSYAARMIAIDTVVHAYHGELHEESGGPGAANLVGEAAGRSPAEASPGWKASRSARYPTGSTGTDGARSMVRLSAWTATTAQTNERLQVVIGYPSLERRTERAPGSPEQEAGHPSDRTFRGWLPG